MGCGKVGMPLASLASMPPRLQGTAVALLPGVSREYLLHHRVCPVAIDDAGILEIAFAPDGHAGALNELGLRPREGWE
jgi:hypothetical protein